MDKRERRQPGIHTRPVSILDDYLFPREYQPVFYIIAIGNNRGKL
jgi:hypothetical protein